MREFKRYVVENWFWIALGLILTGLSVRYTASQRGYQAIGGEWLVLPLILMFVWIVKSMYAEAKVLWMEEDEKTILDDCESETR